ncbi:MAG: zf-HC2 domain-containing protein [Terriglobales bacterium]
MQHVPKIVSERLRAATPVANHPAADELTAFAERSLPELERAIVLEHLARCGDCRDVLALALPASEPVQAVITPARGGWLSWPALRWGFAAAAGVAIVSLGIVQYQRHLQPAAMVAQRAPVPEVVATNVQTQPAAAAPAEKDEQKVKSLPDVSSRADAISAGKPAPQLMQPELVPRARIASPSVQQPAGVVGGAASGAVNGQVAHNQFVHGPQMPNQWQQQNNVQASPAMAPPPVAGKQQAANLADHRGVPPSSRMVEAEASSQAAPANAETNQESSLQAQAGQPEAQPGYALGGPVGKAKPPVTVEAANVPAPQTADATTQQELPVATGNASVTGRNLAQLSIPAASRLPRWTITSAGGLARSFDQGRTWQDVDVNAAPAADFVSVEMAKAAPAKEDCKKVLKAAAAPIIFRAVAALGTEVWAGGSNGALYHSADAGGHWTPVVPSSAGAILSGDILVLDFSDAQHGKVRTSTSEVWITSDGGQTWQKQ